MEATNSYSNPPVPLFQRGNYFLQKFNPLFGKEGKGRFFGRVRIQDQWQLPMGA
jgi:hypothetical protein